MGAALIVVSSVGFASLPIFGKLAYASGTQPMALLAWRFGIAASIMLIAAAVRGRATGQPILPPLRMSITLLFSRCVMMFHGGIDATAKNGSGGC